jgi:SAM-dependent methyltransferase
LTCPLCDSNKTEIKLLKNGYTILHCLNCTHLFTDFVPKPKDVEEIYSDDYFFKGGAGYDDYTREKDLLIKRGEYYAREINQFMSPGTVLDVGAAAGFLLKGFENMGWKGMGIEPNHFMAEYGKNVLGVNIREGIIETVELEDKFDLVILVQVVAHISNLRSSIRKICDLLKPNGHILLETWDKDSMTARIFGKNWHEYSPPSTLNYLSKKTLNKLMLECGFSMIAQGRPEKGISSQHAKSLIKHKLLESKGLKWLAGITSLIPGNMILPYPSEDLFWALYKKI